MVGRGQRPCRRIALEQRGERLMSVGVAGDQHAHTHQRRRIDLREQRQPRVLHDQPAGAEVLQCPLDLRRCVAGVERSGDGAGGEARQVRQNGRRPVGQHQRDPLAAEARLGHPARQRVTSPSQVAVGDHSPLVHERGTVRGRRRVRVDEAGERRL
jgi:hypothetical protein